MSVLLLNFEGLIDGTRKKDGFYRAKDGYLRSLEIRLSGSQFISERVESELSCRISKLCIHEIVKCKSIRHEIFCKM